MPVANVRWTLLGVMLAMLLAMLDNNIVGTAMPTIVRDLGGLEHISWVVTAYTLATAIATPIWGKLGDLYGRKLAFQASIAVFLLASLLAGAAHSMVQLIEFRALQGIGAGGLAAGGFALVGTLVPPRERGRYQGMTATVMAIGVVGGPLVGGFVTGHLGWRWAFYVNLPLGLAALVWVQSLLRLPAPARTSRPRIDWAGIAVLTVTTGSAVLAATWAGTAYAWTSWQVLLLWALAVFGAAGFVLVERRAPEPLLPPRVFSGHRNFPLGVGLLAAVGVVMFGSALYLPLFQQTVQGATATDSGLLLLPMMLPVVLASNLAGKVMSRTGRYKVFPVLGTLLLTAGALLLATMDTGTSRLTAGCAMALLGLGLGFTMQMATTIAQNSVGPADMGAASAATNLFRTLGGSLGVAVFGSLFARAVPATAAGEAYRHAVATGTRHVFLTVAGVCAVAFALALLVKEVPLRGGAGTEKTHQPVTPSRDGVTG
ncbi:DHA2 family efflux MFS transporter permease subunit [Streptomyces sp. SP2-10]|uniref:DHA2 family efflux MFS transporter permease subunit n=1 Tax=Streptomyces sp. SP2-10 TaxID=2873385 RepID=UPI001CA691D6|nr:DHA2 family efflux MFS transporter permease subunit [Streptomyces sp. SP2-10]MBY8843758.1 DHA2 family efflux MFS transporter permease subunit [Streptomyces sp. SP2-10]